MLVVRMSPSSLPQHKNNRPRSLNKTLLLLQPGAKQKEQSWNTHNRKEKKLLSSPWMKSCCCKPTRAFLLSLLFPKDSTGKGRGKNPTTPTHRTETEKQTYPPGMQFISRSPSPLQPVSGRNRGKEGPGRRWREVIPHPPALCKMGTLPPAASAPRLLAPLASPRYLGGAGMASRALYDCTSPFPQPS